MYKIELVIAIIIHLILHTEYNVNYFVSTTISETKASLYVCTHSYEHKDIFVMLHELNKSSKKFIMLFADKVWNRILEPLKGKNITFVYTTPNSNTVERLCTYLKQNINVVLFLYEQNPSKGVYHILNKTKVPLVLVNIRGDLSGTDHYNANFAKILLYNTSINFIVNYIPIDYTILLEPNYFMSTLKKIMYIT